MDCSLPGSSVHGILQARSLECVAMPSSRGSSRLRDQTRISSISCISRQILYQLSHQEAPHIGECIHTYGMICIATFSRAVPCRLTVYRWTSQLLFPHLTLKQPIDHAGWIWGLFPRWANWGTVTLILQGGHGALSSLLTVPSDSFLTRVKVISGLRLTSVISVKWKA